VKSSLANVLQTLAVPCVAFLPDTIRSVRCLVSHYARAIKRCPENSKTIGDHIRKRRIELRLEQQDVASGFGVHRGSIQNWEQNLSAPLPKQMPGIIRFLGYVPFASGDSFAEHLAHARMCAGLTQEELSLAAGCERNLVGRWERGSNPPSPRNLLGVVHVLRTALQKERIEETVRRLVGTIDQALGSAPPA